MNQAEPEDAVAVEAALASFSAVLLKLGDLPDAVDTAVFQERALAEVGRLIAFDSAIWGAGVATATGPVVHTMHLHHQPPEMMASWEAIKHLDPIAAAMLQQPGTTVLADAESQLLGPTADKRIQAHCRRFDIAQVACTAFVDPVSRLLNAVSLYRSDPTHAFSRTEQVLKQNLMPHLARTWGASRLAMVSRQAALAPPFGRALALCDEHRFLHAASPSFLALLGIEWPQWQGPQVPEALPGNTARQPFSGERIACSAARFNDLWLLGARVRKPVDSLSAREREVAMRYANGASYREVARTLHISPDTVRNHVKHVYEKLGIGSKLELARLLRD
jgi:DNA-binding CsgD family transcriptional regulator